MEDTTIFFFLPSKMKRCWQEDGWQKYEAEEGLLLLFLLRLLFLRFFLLHFRRRGSCRGGEELHLCGDVPDLEGVAVAAGGEEGAIGGEGDGPDGALVGAEAVGFLLFG